MQNEHLVNQAKSAYLASEGEYENIAKGANSYDIKQAEEAVNIAKINLEYIEENFSKSEELFHQGVISKIQLDEIEKNYNIALAQYNSANSKLNSIRSGPA